MSYDSDDSWDDSSDDDGSYGDDGGYGDSGDAGDAGDSGGAGGAGDAGDAGDGTTPVSGGVTQQRGYDHEVPVTPSHDGEQQAYYTPTCDCGWAGTQQHGGQGAWDQANNEGVQHVQSSKADGKQHHFTIGVYEG